MFRVFVSLAMAVLWTVAAHAQQPANSRLDDIIKRGTLRVGMTGDYLPFTYLDKTTSKFRGFDVDMAEALGKALGVRVEFVQTAWPATDERFRSRQFRHRDGRCLDHARPAEKGNVLHADHA